MTASPSVHQNSDTNAYTPQNTMNQSVNKKSYSNAYTPQNTVK